MVFTAAFFALGGCAYAQKDLYCVYAQYKNYKTGGFMPNLDGKGPIITGKIGRGQGPCGQADRDQKLAQGGRGQGCRGQGGRGRGMGRGQGAGRGQRAGGSNSQGGV